MRNCAVCVEKFNGVIDILVSQRDRCASEQAESQTTDTHPLKAEIAALADELESMNRDEFNIRKHVLIAGLMRQLSAL